MNQHLRPEQVSLFLMGDVLPEVAEHAGACVLCRGEVMRLESSLALFRGSVRHASERLSHPNCRAQWGETDHPDRPFKPASLDGLYGRQKRSWLMSLGFQAAVVTLLFAWSNQNVHQAAPQAIEIYAPNRAEYQPKPQQRQGGGGGGDRSPLAASQGKLPKAALKQFTPPLAVPNDPDPKLTMDPSIVAPPDIPLPQVAANNYGDPLARLSPLSNGPGSGGGIGAGPGGGVGPGSGTGLGPGSGGAFGGGVFRVGGGVTAPSLVFRVEPEYSEEARKAKYQGTVVLSVIVDTTGRAVNLQIIRSLGLGLDEKAVEAVKKWKFKPGLKEGRPVAVQAQIEVNFRLL